MRTLSIIYYIILEYLLILRKRVVMQVRIHPPRGWLRGNKGDIVLVPGFNETWVYLETIGNHLNKHGYRVHILPKMLHNHMRVRQAVQILEEYVKEKDIDNVVLIGHSKGGIIAKSFIDTSSESNRIRCVISIASPYQGSIFGYLWILSLKELISGKNFITTFLKEVGNNHKIYNLYARVDNHVVPNKNAILPGAKNICIDIVGHTRILEDTRTLEAIDSILR